ncbi:phage scaffolding protein [Lysinibacillus xylanilyticus]|uniref:phage scaffolding protein n=1 Tax=Lysinibacillus xylanilyticus TaxID=582475 RepID=UPI00083CA21D|nr:phage scaffolding protein [Lysinibacillus xylanilyticus]
MKKEDLIAMGLSEEQADKIIEGFGTMIPKSRFDEVNGENKSLKEQLDDRDKQLKELAKNEEATEGLKSEITRLQDENKATTEKHSAEVKQLKINSAVELALTGAKARNLTATKALLDLNGVEIDKDGNVVGLEDKVKALVENEETKFMFASDETVITGTTPGGQPNGGGDPVDTSKMTYSQLVAYQEANPGAKI